MMVMMKMVSSVTIMVMILVMNTVLATMTVMILTKVLAIVLISIKRDDWDDDGDADCACDDDEDGTRDVGDYDCDERGCFVMTLLIVVIMMAMSSKCHVFDNAHYLYLVAEHRFVSVCDSPPFRALRALHNRRVVLLRMWFGRRQWKPARPWMP